MNAHNRKTRLLKSPRVRAAIRECLLGGFALALVAGSAIVVKELSTGGGVASAAPLAMVDSAGNAIDQVNPRVEIVDPLADTAIESQDVGPNAPLDTDRFETDTSVRWFNGRPVRPVRTIWMTVTAYSPDWRSCGDFADDITASNHHVQTNGYQLVAADSRVLPLGSIISIPGYADTRVVPVLDRGGKIKGNRLDVLFPTHEQARQWGVKKLRVVVWDYADGKGNSDWRRIRDGR